MIECLYIVRGIFTLHGANACADDVTNISQLNCESFGFFLSHDLNNLNPIDHLTTTHLSNAYYLVM